MTKNIERKSRRTAQERISKAKQSKSRDQMVLVVDDDALALDAIVRLIRSAGFKVRGFSHPRALLNEPIRAGNVCLVADIYLPEMNGIELRQTLAANGRPVPTILITGRNDELTHRLVENSEAIAVLYKPIDEVSLLGAISCCLKS